MFIPDSDESRSDLLKRQARLLQRLPDRDLIVAMNARGVPEIRIPDSHPGRYTHETYFRPIMRIIANGEDSDRPTDLEALATMVACAPAMIEELGKALERCDREIEGLQDALDHADELPIADEQILKNEVRKAMWDFRESPDAQADRAIELIRRYLPAPQIIEREKVVTVPKTLISHREYRQVFSAIETKVGLVDPELISLVAQTVIEALNLTTQEVS